MGRQVWGRENEKDLKNINGICSGEKLQWEFLERIKFKERNEWGPRSKD